MSYMMVLSIKCLACGFEFESAYQMDEKSFETTEVKDRNETCSQCGKESPYNKENYYFR
jgi:hypothetical protein